MSWEDVHAENKAIFATESELLNIGSEVGRLASSASWFTWQLAETLRGRDLDAMTVGELRELIRAELRTATGPR